MLLCWSFKGAERRAGHSDWWGCSLAGFPTSSSPASGEHSGVPSRPPSMRFGSQRAPSLAFRASVKPVTGAIKSDRGGMLAFRLGVFHRIGDVLF